MNHSTAKFHPGELASHIHNTLAEYSHPDRAYHEKRYLKSDDAFHGIAIPELRKIAKDFKKNYPLMPITEVFSVAESLWKGNYHEEKSVALYLVSAYSKHLNNSHWERLESWLPRATDWALTDELSSHLFGEIILREKENWQRLFKWTASPNHWQRRCSVVSLLVPLRKGVLSVEPVVSLCSRLMADEEYFGQKSLGWILREVAMIKTKPVVAFLEAWKEKTARLILREAVRKLSQEQQERILDKQ